MVVQAYILTHLEELGTLDAYHSVYCIRLSIPVSVYFRCTYDISPLVLNDLFLPYRVDSLSDENKMTARNLAVVFTPTLMRSPSDSEDHILLTDLPLQKTFVEYLIMYHQTLFKL